MKNKYLVKVVRTGSVLVEADDEIDALDIANDIKADSVCWSDDLEVTDAIEDDSELPSVLLDPSKRGICDKCANQHAIYNFDIYGTICHCRAYGVPCSCKHKCEMYERRF